MKLYIKTAILFFFISSLFSCVPDTVKDKLGKSMEMGMNIMADQEFKKAIGNIELYKLRHGKYPSSLSDLDFLSMTDSSISNFVEYQLMDTVYSLNVTAKFPNISDNSTLDITLHYPKEFWNGLGCVQSNAK